MQSWPLAAAGRVNAAIVLTRSSAPWLDALQPQWNFSGKRSVRHPCVWVGLNAAACNDSSCKPVLIVNPLRDI